MNASFAYGNRNNKKARLTRNASGGLVIRNN